MSYTEPRFATRIIVRASEVDLGWQLPDETNASEGDDDDCVALDEADLLEVEAA